MLKIDPKNVEHIVFDHDGTLVDTNGQGRMYPGVWEMLDELGQRGVKLYVWTARTRHSTVEFLKSLDIITRFEELYCSTDSYPKPDVEGLKEMLGDVDPRSVVVVGDSMADMAGSSNFGSHSIGVTWATSNDSRHRQALFDAGAKHVAATVKECKEKIFELIK